jgi:glycosyltransferase involved in cell wall biosynthesis
VDAVQTATHRLGGMTPGRPLVSIGMPVLNGERYLHGALSSLVSQDHDDLEILISDNGSTDGTAAICHEFSRVDPRVSYHRNAENIGASANFNRVVELSSGTLFMWAAHDDLWHPRFVSDCVAALERAPGAVLACTGIQFIDPDGRPYKLDGGGLDNPDLSMPTVGRRIEALLSRRGWYAIYGLIRREVLDRTRLFLPVYGPDVVLLLELLLLGPAVLVPEVRFYYRMFPDKTEQDRAAQTDPTTPTPASYLTLSRNLLAAIGRSHYRFATQVLLQLIAARTMYLSSRAWHDRFRREANRLLAAAVESGTPGSKASHALSLLLRIRSRFGFRDF